MNKTDSKQVINIDMVADGDLINRVVDIFNASPITVIAKGTRFNGKQISKAGTIKRIKRKLSALDAPFITSEIVLLYEAFALYLNLHAESDGNLEHAEKLFHACEGSLKTVGLIEE